MNDAERKAKLREIGRLMESDRFTAGLGLEYSPPLEHGEGGELAIRPDIWVVPKEEENPVAYALEYADGSTDLLDALRPGGRYRHRFDRLGQDPTRWPLWLLVVCKTREIRDAVEQAGVHLSMLTTTETLFMHFMRYTSWRSALIWRCASQPVSLDGLMWRVHEWQAYPSPDPIPFSAWGEVERVTMLMELARDAAKKGFYAAVFVAYWPGPNSATGTEVRELYQLRILVGPCKPPIPHESHYVNTIDDVRDRTHQADGTNRAESKFPELLICRDGEIEDEVSRRLASSRVLTTTKTEFSAGPYFGDRSVWRFEGRAVNIDHLVENPPQLEQAQPVSADRADDGVGSSREEPEEKPNRPWWKWS